MSAPSTDPTPRPPRPLGPGVAGLLSVLVFASLQFIPVIGIFLAVLAPLPLLHYAASGRPSFIAWGWVAVALVGALLVWPLPELLATAAGFLLVAVWPAVSIEAWVRRNWNIGRWLAIVGSVALLISCGLLVAAAWPGRPAEALARLFARAMAQAGDMSWVFGGPGEGTAEVVQQAMAMVAYLAPALAALYVVAVAMWARPRLPLLGFPRGGEVFAEYASEEWLPAGFLVGGLLWVFAPEPGKWLGANVLIAVLGLYFVHGLAIIHFYLGRRLSGNRWVRLGVVVLCLQLPVAAVLSLLGLIDAFFTLRRGGGSNEESES